MSTHRQAREASSTADPSLHFRNLKCSRLNETFPSAGGKIISQRRPHIIPSIHPSIKQLTGSPIFAVSHSLVLVNISYFSVSYSSSPKQYPLFFASTTSSNFSPTSVKLSPASASILAVDLASSSPSTLLRVHSPLTGLLTNVDILLGRQSPPMRSTVVCCSLGVSWPGQ